MNGKKERKKEGRKRDVNVVRVSSERRLDDVQTNDSDVPSGLRWMRG